MPEPGPGNPPPRADAVCAGGDPDCGFGTFADRPVNDADTARRKPETLARAAAIPRKG